MFVVIRKYYNSVVWARISWNERTSVLDVQLKYVRVLKERRWVRRGEKKKATSWAQLSFTRSPAEGSQNSGKECAKLCMPKQERFEMGANEMEAYAPNRQQAQSQRAPFPPWPPACRQKDRSSPCPPLPDTHRWAKACEARVAFTPRSERHCAPTATLAYHVLLQGLASCMCR